MTPLISALQFLTILPIRGAHRFSARAMVPCFPLVGLIIGALLAGADHLAQRAWSAEAAAVLDVAFLAWITGALHLDGLGDTADGLYGRRPPEKALAIMKDSRIGAMGLVAVVMGLGIKWAGIHDLGSDRALMLLLIPAYARAGVLFGFRFLPYGRPEGGTGHAFFEHRIAWHGFWGVILVMGLSLMLGRGAWRINIAFAAVTVFMLHFYRRRMGCITGDMLGAMTEVTESALFLVMAFGAVS